MLSLQWSYWHFFDPEIFIKKIKSLLSKNGIAIILSPFNEENVDVIVNHRTSLNKKWESGNNVFLKLYERNL